MLKNYFKIAFRNLFRNGLFSFINIFGLALSMSVCLLVLMRVKDRLDYDQFHPHPARTYRIITQLTNKEGNTFRFASSPLPLAKTLSSEYNFTEAIVRLYPAATQKVVVAKKKMLLDGAFTEPDFFKVFGFSLKQGDTRTALQEPNSIILSRETALKFFGRTDVIGQTIQFERWGNFLVTGVLDRPKGKSHIDFDAYLSLSSVPALEKTGKLAAALDDWNSIRDGYTYLVVKKGTTRGQLNGAIGRIAGNLMKISRLTGQESISFETQPLNKIILGEELRQRLGDTGSRSKTWSEIIVAFIILLMACFNYTNLSIARSLKRGKEIGIRKVSGARRLQVFTQFIIESMVTTFLALGLACMLLKLMMDHAPFIQELVPAGATLNIGLLKWFGLFSLFAGLLAGVLPAWALSAFKPVDVLKNLSTIRLFGGNGFRKSLIVIQLSISLFIIIFTIIFFYQFDYMANADPGFRRDKILDLSLNGADYKVLANTISRLNGVEEVSASSAIPGRFGFDYCGVKPAPGRQPVQICYSDIDKGFVDLMGLELLTGSDFTNENADQGEQKVLLNENAIQVLQMKTPAAAIGRQLWINDTTQVRVAGVIRDFYSSGLDFPIAPMIFRNRADHFNYLNIRTAVRPDKALIASIQKIWKAGHPGQPLAYAWLNDELYESKSPWRTTSMLGFLSFIAISIACLGLLGMVTYSTETRRKEIGIRKVLGAGISTIMLMLSKGFLKLIFIASAIALPASYIAGRLFLEMFANRITIGPGMLAGGFMAMLLLVLLTIGSRIYRVAIANPAGSLRAD